MQYSITDCPRLSRIFNNKIKLSFNCSFCSTTFFFFFFQFSISNEGESNHCNDLKCRQQHCLEFFSSRETPRKEVSRRIGSSGWTVRGLSSVNRESKKESKLGSIVGDEEFLTTRCFEYLKKLRIVKRNVVKVKPYHIISFSYISFLMYLCTTHSCARVLNNN